MSPSRHPAEDTLLRFAGGRLPFGHALVIAAHLPFCPDCQAAVREGEAVGGALLASLPPADVAADALNRVLARLDAPANAVRQPLEPTVLADGVPLPACLRGLARPVWRWTAPGISRIAVAAPGAQHVYVLRLAPGVTLPEHGHHGWEAACVLAGRFSDITGTYGPGDVAEMEGGTPHQPVAGAEEACICLVAWEGPLRMHGRLARLLRPLLGI